MFPFRLPPLRARLEDLAELLELLLSRFREKTGKQIRGIAAAARRAIQDYCWPGNVRELENAIEFAFVTCQGKEIALADLPHDIRQFEVRHATCAERQRRQDAGGRKTASPEVLRSAADLRRLLRECSWNKAEAARRLGISRTLVWKWMKKHNLPLRQ